ncbi:metalloprotease m41 [Ophiostoma piceae UAMH 11346]|uniref:Metalloprotease m41 n=1 Tax=Ophiostoma piceae (strain UAMH 11346) TaxID=1262450 RepID=S3CP82_OPHP1|nr:metalloprotease m41 [Ophiostoma piceae UAMH 11346]
MSTAEERNRDLEELVKKLKRQNEEAELKLKEAEEKAKLDKEAAEREKEKANVAKEAAEREKEKANVAKEAAEERANVLEQHQAPTSFVNYIRSVEQYVYSTLSVERDSSKTSTVQSVTSVVDKFYPQHFQPWTDFAALHNTTFDRLEAVFANNAVFAPMISAETIGNDLSPRIANEFSLYPFLRAAIEKPASRVVSKYLRVTSHPHINAVKFRNHYYGVTPTIGQQVGEEGAEGVESAQNPLPSSSLSLRPAKRRSPVKELGIPDRWLFAIHDGEKMERILVGEVKPAHILHSEKLSRVMSAPPSDDFFPQAAKQDGVAPTLGSAVPGSMYVAKAICQAYHYMIASGLEYGYVASGDGLVFLRVLEDSPNTLYYFWSVFPVHQSETTATAREPRETAMAHMATLCMLALESTPRPPTWIADRDSDLNRWPKSAATGSSLTQTAFPLLPRDEDGGGGASGSGAAGGAAGGTDGMGGDGSSRVGGGTTSGGQKRPRSTTTTTATGNKATANEVRVESAETDLPALPYCTQGCLRSLCRGQPLDDKCPNMELHRAAACSQGVDSRHHALTASQLQSRLVAQLDKEMSRDCENLLWDGFFGRYGVLFKLTVTGFGYTFVGKAVQHAHYYVLAHEATIYAALENFQGRLIPVCLGLIELERSIPLGNCQYVAHMLLMAYAGTAGRARNAPGSVDLDVEEEKTTSALYAAGLDNDDIHGGNFAWNEETQCVMQFDFDQAGMRAVALDPSPAPAKPATPTASLRSPLMAKRDLYEYRSSNAMQDERDIVTKRARGPHTTVS